MTISTDNWVSAPILKYFFYNFNNLTIINNFHTFFSVNFQNKCGSTRIRIHSPVQDYDLACAWRQAVIFPTETTVCSWLLRPS